METYSIEEAMAFLHCGRNAIMKHVNLGNLPACKIGLRWIFLKDDLVNFIHYMQNERANQRCKCSKEENSWHSTSEETPGGLLSQRQTESALDNLLALMTVQKHKSSLTN